ncbi:ribonuclease J [Xylanibacillus composti]|uniref:Ribonuclease J n=1 Tax=Xylanibacillus composti TaxID=1572762 RepID=A0A8J4H6J9_9BACL|nr:ribonuclease J [Xylanibacillus composti]MDT9726318.1 ribonuclease J [Xylanibacillus composti]GIQ70576.1 ribonuclease J [Xylanibacillus composti]
MNNQATESTKTKKTKRNYYRKPAVKIFALGGLEEIGKNMYAIQYGKELILIDAGIKFPDADMPGVDSIIPNIQYLKENKHMLKGIFLTHGHEDHIGGLPFVLRELSAPVYGAGLTIGFVRTKLEEHGLLGSSELHVINEESVIRFRQLKVRFFRTHHSIPDSLAVVIETPHGTIVHTGDFKFDFTPTEQATDWGQMAKIGRSGVLALLADSTNSEKPGFTPSEKAVGRAIRETFRKCDGRILFATFASNVHRLQQVVEAAEECGRRIAVIGRSMERAFKIGQELNYIRPSKHQLIDVRQLDRYPDHEVVIVCTGSQGETNAALTRIATGAHKHVSLYEGDTVIFSSSPIPGNTQNVYRSIDLLLRAGAEVVHGSIFDIHASGHGCEEDLKLMLRFMQPKFFIPIHGEYRMLRKHAEIAEQTGTERDNIFLLRNGQPLHVTRHKARVGKDLPAGQVLVKGSTTNPWEETIMEERRALGTNGVLIVVLTIDPKQNKMIGRPELITRGFVYVRESAEIISAGTKVVRTTVRLLQRRKKFIAQQWEQKIIERLTEYCETTMDRTPVVMPIFSYVEQPAAAGDQE